MHRGALEAVRVLWKFVEICGILLHTEYCSLAETSAPSCLVAKYFMYHLPLMDWLRESVHISINSYPVKECEGFFVLSSEQVLQNSLGPPWMDLLNAWDLI